MLDIVFGKKSNPQAVDILVESLKQSSASGTLYIGYPIFDVDDESLLTDALLISQENGVIAFDLTTASETSPEKITEYQDDLFRGLLKKFLAEKQLVKKRKLTFEIEVFSLRNTDDLDDVEIVTPDSMEESLSECQPINETQFKVINATIQKTGVLKPSKKRKNVTKDESFGGVMRKIEKEIANLDSWQKKAAIETPDKPQRIRGLAGCGKTIILAMKAAYLHAYEPEKKVAVTFQSRALYQQFQKLIEKFYFEHTRDEPDYTNLKIRHAWGSNSDVGIYSEICERLGVEPLNFSSAKAKYGQENAFGGACQELLDFIDRHGNNDPIYDYILIDEAQDFPESFFKLIYHFVKHPKKIVWAYDELQNLGDFSMQPPEVLFGKDANSTPYVSLENEEGKPQQDIMLPICYRNPPWTLTLALALGLGIYRKSGLVRMFSDPALWKNIGYETYGGKLKLGEGVTLQRSQDRTPDYFYEFIHPDEAILYSAFDSKGSQAEWIASQINKNLTQDELEHEDILVVFPDAYTLASESSHLVHSLRKHGIDSHIVGKGTSRNTVFIDNSIAITHIYRAKGNEAPMIYAANSHFCYAGLELGKKRNALFTAITRAKAWVRITGVGPSMKALCAEIENTFENNFMLDFKYPTKEELIELEDAYKDQNDEEKKEIQEGFSKIKKLRQMLEKGEMSIEDVPEDLRDIFI
ncbi:DEAD/DEAH box helicase [Halomonas denitrificans]|uniref:DEAD/DEAH box helicase n=1 Tax=Halomonas denitrificans TaxID=370769 RepID=UPI0013004D2E|nr:ATP-binding domain-containing protein [Halomonas denitrificans]